MKLLLLFLYERFMHPCAHNTHSSRSNWHLKQQLVHILTSSNSSLGNLIISEQLYWQWQQKCLRKTSTNKLRSLEGVMVAYCWNNCINRKICVGVRYISIIYQYNINRGKEIHSKFHNS